MKIIIINRKIFRLAEQRKISSSYFLCTTTLDVFCNHNFLSKKSSIFNYFLLNKYYSCESQIHVKFFIISLVVNFIVFLLLHLIPNSFQKTPKPFFHILPCSMRKSLHGLHFPQSTVLYYYLHCAICKIH